MEINPMINERPFCTTDILPSKDCPSFSRLIYDVFTLFTEHNNSGNSIVVGGKSCSEDTLFIWIPIMILLLTYPLETIWQQIRRRPIQKFKIKQSNDELSTMKLSITIFYVCKMLSVCTMYIISLCRIVYWYLYADNNDLGLLDPWAPVMADATRAIQWLLVIIIMVLNRRNRILSCCSMFLYLLSQVLLNFYTIVQISLRIFGKHDSSLWLITSDPIMVSSSLLYMASLYYLFFLECLSDDDSFGYKRTINTSHKSLKEKLTSPEDTASFFSKLTFSWFSNLVLNAWWKGTILPENLWLLSTTNVSHTVLHSFKQIWLKRKDKEFNIMSLLFKLYWMNLLWVAFLKLWSSMFIFVNPIVLDWIITFLNPTSEEPYWKGFFYASLMFISPMLESMLTNQHEYYLNLITMKMKTCLTAIVYNKSLRLSNTAKQQFCTGEIVNLISVDALRIVDLINNINTLWSAPLQIAIGVYLLWLQLSYASFAGFSYMLLIVPVNIALTNKIRHLQLHLMTEKDSRSKLMSEILDGIKVIKLNAWEKHFEKNVSYFRAQEMKHLKYIAYCQAFMTTFFSSAAIFVALFSFLAYTLISSDNILDANRAFVSLSLFNIIRVPLTFLPMFFSFAGIAFVSIERIDDFLNAPELINYNGNLIDNPPRRMSTDLLRRSPSIDSSNIAIRIKNGNFNWIEDDPVPTVNSIDLEIQKRTLTTIVGGVGSGKSSLLSAILGEMEKLSGQVEIKGKIAYVPQEAWILNATIRENIILNKKYDEKKYKKVLEACALQVDMIMFAAGDMTEVGEKGINLSGGQKQRISLARAVYSNSDIYLFDNPLSALDVHVGQHIFDQVIGPKGCLRNKTRLLVTAKMSLLPYVDEIIYISRGEIKDKGTFEDLIDSRGPFSEYVAEYFIDQQSGFETDLDEDDAEFVNQMEPKIKRVIERVQLSRSTSLHRNISMNEARYHSTFQTSLTSAIYQRSFSRSSIFESDEIFAENVNITQGRLIQAEEMAEGSVNTINHRIYFKSIGLCICITVLLTLMLSNVFQVLSSLWLSDWANDSLKPIEQNDKQARMMRVIVYGIFGVIEVTFTFLGTLQICLGCVRASRILHDQMFTRIIRAPMAFFDTTPMGRILNRFTRDIDVIDLRISSNLRLFFMQIFRTVVAFSVIGLEAPLILLLLLPLSLAYWLLQKLFINTSRQLKRIEAVTRSPLNNHLSETVNGTTSIRSYGLTRKFTREMLKRIDENNQSYWLSFTSYRWLSVRLEFISYTIVFLSTLFAVLYRGTLSPGVAGLAISYSLNITAIFNLLIRSYSEIETNFVSVERIVEYMETTKEKQMISNELARIPAEWPFRGEITFDNYSTQYRPGLKLCLKRINLTIPGGNKVAIVGRTGSGKSSLSLALFRILDPVEGTIYIDNIDIRKCTLETLRKSLTIVPQEPIIFTATIKENVDPLNQFSKEEIIQSMNDANLSSFMETINYDIDYQLNAGDNLSVGQKQLICLARALLKKSSVIVFDEATASVDYETDHHIHETIFSERFKSKTVLMIAHRLDRIMDYDYVLVMDNGEMAEFDNPYNLTTQQDGQFYSLAKEAKII